MAKPSAKKVEAETAAKDNPDVVIVKAATAPKLSPRGEGGIRYQVGRVAEEVYIRIEKNEGGGSCSHEFVPFGAIRAAITPIMKRGEPFKSDSFAGSFVGRSQCNSGFLVAALRAEGLFIADNEHRGMSRLAGDIDAWENAMKKMSPPLIDGKPQTVKLHPEPKVTGFLSKKTGTPSDGANTPDGRSAQKKAKVTEKPSGEDSTPSTPEKTQISPESEGDSTIT